MTFWTHLIRFVAVEDNHVHLGQLVNSERDVGKDSVNGIDIPVYLIEGTIFDGRVTDQIMHVKQVTDSLRLHPLFRILTTDSRFSLP